MALPYLLARFQAHAYGPGWISHREVVGPRSRGARSHALALGSAERGAPWWFNATERAATAPGPFHALRIPIAFARSHEDSGRRRERRFRS
jgi:hypothetical protein